MNKAKMFTEITVTDPDTGGEVEVSMFKHENGGIFGIDSSYIDQVLGEQEGDCIIPDPFIDDPMLAAKPDDGTNNMLMLEGV